MLALTLGLLLGAAAQDAFADGFEGAALDPFWGGGGPALSTEQSHSGAQSLKFQGVGTIDHNFGTGAKRKGSLVVWFFDTLDNGLNVTMVTQDYLTPNVDTFEVRVHSIFAGVYAINSIDGHEATTVARTPGWHEFRISFGAATTELRIDGALVKSLAGDYGYTYVALGSQSGGTAFLDDFSIAPLPGPGDFVLDLRDDVDALVEAGDLPQGPGHGLNGKLEEAFAAIGLGDDALAIERLTSFIHQVNGLARAGKLSSEDADALIAAAQGILDLLSP